MKTILIFGMLVCALHVAAQDSAPDNSFSEAIVLLKSAEPDLSMYARSIVGTGHHGSHFDVSVTYRLKEKITADSNTLKQYVTNAFLATDWTHGLPPGAKFKMWNSSGEIFIPFGFRKEPFQPIPGDYSPAYVAVYFLKDGTELRCTYVFIYTKNAPPEPEGDPLKSTP